MREGVRKPFGHGAEEPLTPVGGGESVTTRAFLLAIHPLGALREERQTLRLQLFLFLFSPHQFLP